MKKRQGFPRTGGYAALLPCGDWLRFGNHVSGGGRRFAAGIYEGKA